MDLKFKISSFDGGCGCGCGCVGVALENDAVYVTNTTTPGGPVAKFTHGEWSAFVAGVKNGEFEI